MLIDCERRLETDTLNRLLESDLRRRDDIQVSLDPAELLQSFGASSKAMDSNKLFTLPNGFTLSLFQLQQL